MTRRRLIVFGLLAELLALCAGVQLLWPPSSVITRENAAKIQVGMTLGDVEVILGGPSRDESTGQVEMDRSDPHRQEMNIPGDADMSLLASRSPPAWQSDYVLLGVLLDSEGRVAHIALYPLRRTSESPLDILRHWLSLHVNDHPSPREWSRR